MNQPAVLFDRDGILVKNINGEAPTKPHDLELISEIIPVIKKIQQFGYPTFILSNQPDLSDGIISKTTQKKLLEKFLNLLKKNNISFTKIYYCFHNSSDNCSCKKPQPGMLLKASKEFNVNLENSFMIGDRASDIKAGSAVNSKTILFDPSNSQQKYLNLLKVKPDYKISSLSQIENLIVSNLYPQMAIVLAAGKGERMMPLTKITPKPLLKINKKPMIEYTLNLLKTHHIQKVGINAFYLKEKINNYFNTKVVEENTIIVNEKFLSGTAGGLKNVFKKLKPKTPFFVISSDMLVNFNLTDIYRFHLTHGGIATICCYWRKKSELKKSGLISFEKSSRQIIKFLERPKLDKEIISQWVSSSVYVFNPEIINFIPNQLNDLKIIDIAKNLIPILLKSKRKLFAYPVNKNKFYQLGIDTPDRIKRAEEDIKSGKFIP